MSPHPDPPRELELKFILPPGLAVTIARECGAPDRAYHVLSAVYFDTRKLALRRAGLSLRLRRQGGVLTQTLKQSQAGAGPDFGRAEWEVEVGSDSLDLAALSDTPAAGILADREPLPLVDIRTRRQVIAPAVEGARLELCLDEVEAAAAGRSLAFEELELELKEGPVSALMAYALDLQKKYDLELAFRSKADRGFELLETRRPAASKFQAPPLSPDASVADAFRAPARAALDHIARNAELFFGSPTKEAVHQMRVGARRLRALIGVYAAILQDNQRIEMVEGLRWLGREMDEARNLDVFLEGAWARAERRARRHGGLGEAAQLRSQLEARRAAAYARAAAAVDSPRFRRLLIELLAWVEAGPWTAPGAPAEALREAPARAFAAKALRRSRRKLLKKGANFADLSERRRHKARIQGKKLRYAAEAFAPLFSDRADHAKAFLAPLEALQDELGALNDIATAKALTAGLPAVARLTGSAPRRERHDVRRAQACLEELKAAKRFWKT